MTPRKRRKLAAYRSYLRWFINHRQYRICLTENMRFVLVLEPLRIKLK